MRFLKIVAALLVPFTVLSQNFHDTQLRLKNSADKMIPLSRNITLPAEHKTALSLLDSVTESKQNTSVKRSKKSPGLAFIYGLFIPGMGHVYANSFNSGKYFMISEAALWLSYAAFTIYGNWLLDDAYSYAGTHAGVTVEGKAKDDKFFVDIANYENVDEYNNEKLRFGEYDKIYYPDLGYGFHWNSKEERLQYRADKIGGDRTLNDRLFIVGAVLINHLVSGISAVFAANSYNSRLSQNSSGGIRMSAGVIKNFNRVDGIKLNISKRF